MTLTRVWLVASMWSVSMRLTRCWQVVQDLVAIWIFIFAGVLNLQLFSLGEDPSRIGPRWGQETQFLTGYCF